MKIGIDATSICRKITGIEYYTLNLVRNILQIDNVNNYVVFFRKEIHPELVEFKDKARFLVCPVENQVFCEQVWLPYVAVKEKVDLMHFPALPPGLFTLKRYLVTIHDASIWRYPHWYSWKSRCYTLPLSRLSSKQATHILTVSRYSKSELARFAKINRDKITVSHGGTDGRFKVIKEKIILRRVKQKFNLSEKFILTVSSLDLVRNFERLLKAYAIFSQNQPDPSYKLVLTGKKSLGLDRIMNKIQELELKDRIILTGYVSDEDLAGLYNLAAVFIYLPLYAGFGLPPLQAMACGTPVITSNIASLPEVVGDAAITVDPYNVKVIAVALKELVNNKKLRDKLMKKGFERIRLFNWKEVAKKTIETYKKVFANETHEKKT